MSAASTDALKIIIAALSVICGDKYVLTAAEELYHYERDQTLDLHFPFDVLVKPGTTEEVAAVLKCCNQYKMPVTPRGGGSGVTGGALPVNGGVVLSLERLNKIISINKIDGYIIAEAGVITAALCDYAEQAGLYFPVAPSSSAYTVIGGNVAENAGSINSCKYGSTARYVLNLEVVLPAGEIIWTGANVSKNVTGLNLTQLFVGSEGTLGIITKVVYRLLHKPAHEVSLLAAFENMEDACNAVVALKQSGLSPSAVELVGQKALQITAAYLNEPLPLLKNGIGAHLLVNLQEHTEADLLSAMEKTATVITEYSEEELLTAVTASEKERLWKLRFSIGAALTSENRKYRDIDSCVPLSNLYVYMKNVVDICEHYQIPVASFGHAWDGNLHTMLMLQEHSDEKAAALQQAIYEIYACAINLGGVISGEHGIGLLQKEFMGLQFSKPHLSLMQSIKQLFDPNGILNPGKVYLTV